MTLNISKDSKIDFEKELKKFRMKNNKSSSNCLFEEVIFSSEWSFIHDDPSSESTVQTIQKSQNIEVDTKIETNKEKFSAEKEVVFNSLKQFADKKIEESNSDSFKVPGGVVERKLTLPNDYNDFLFEGAQIQDIEQLKHFSKYSTLPIKTDVKVCFLTDAPKLDDSKDEFTYYFEEETAHLFRRMVTAMKLSTEEFFISDVSDQELLNNELSILKPQFIISLGATATHKILSMKERLSKIHGHFYKKAIKYVDDSAIEIEITPIFHPEFLRINPNMKKTAWVDMQKVMQKLGKIS